MIKPGKSALSIQMDPSNGDPTVSSDSRKKSNLGSVLSAHNINYKVKVSTKWFGGKVEKQILSDVTSVFNQGMTAILGPTGSGKTTLLDILANRKDTAGVSGDLLLDGKHVPANFKCMVGYVVQHDVVMATLTVRENLQFSAALRLPSSVSSEERNERVDSVIKELSLDKCAETRMGNEFIRGVSGGERKRCSIGMELIISPPVLFLDEPTTGLDADTAYTVLRCLKRLSTKGRTIIFSIHQPRYSIFCLFDSIILLAGGCVVYTGPSHEALDFFASQGYRCEVHNNPPDFFMDVINNHHKPVSDGAETDTTDESSQTDTVSIESKLVTGFRQSSWNKRLQEEAAAILSQFEVHSIKRDPQDELTYPTSFFRQIYVVAGRSLKDIVRNPHTSVLTIGASLLFSAFISSIYWQLKEDPVTAFKDRSGALFFLIVNQLVFNLAAVEVFIAERDMFMHEHISGFYRVSVYFLVKIMFDIIPLRTVPVLIMCPIVYFTVGLNPGLDHLLLLVLTLLSVTLAGAGVCFFLCASISVFAIAHMGVALLYLLMMVFGGFLVSLDSIGPLLHWAQYISFFKYSQAALYINEFKGRIFCGKNGTACETGDNFLRNNQMAFSEPWDFWKNQLALQLMAAVLMILTYVQLRRMKKTI